MQLAHLVTLALLACSASVAAEWSAQKDRREAVKAAFVYNYEQYERYAWAYDVLQPISKAGADTNVLAGFGGSVVDAMSTMHVMNLSQTPAYERALRHVRATDYSQTYLGDWPGEVSLFELTIRYLGGLLSAFQLGGEQKQERFLVQQATVLADRLSFAWSRSTRIPHNKVNINKGHAVPSTVEPANLAEAGTLTMEWATLSRYTLNDTYRALATQSMDAILQSTPVFAGLWAQGIWPESERTHKDYVTWSGGTDSFIEYLIKYPLMLGDDRHKYLRVYGQAVDSSIRELLQKTGVGNMSFFADHSEYYGHGLIYSFSHLACFAGGNIAMAGRVMERDDWTQIGLELAESCAATYRMTATGVGPIVWHWMDADGNARGAEHVTPAQRAWHAENGVFLTAKSWNHQPEVIESMMYAYRITGMEFWRDWAWDAFVNIQRYCDTQHGWAGMVNVNDASTGAYDEQQSFLYAELLKYLYLMFDDPDRFSLDDWVFNTEAHPLRRRANARFGKIQQAPFPYKRITADPAAGVQRPPTSAPPSSDGKHALLKPLTPHKAPPSSFPPASSSGGAEMQVQLPAAHHDESDLKRLFGFASGMPSVGASVCDAHDSRLRALVCRTYGYLLWPFALVVGYKLSLRIGQVMRRNEQQMYQRNAA